MDGWWGAAPFLKKVFRPPHPTPPKDFRAGLGISPRGGEMPKPRVEVLGRGCGGTLLSRRVPPHPHPFLPHRTDAGPFRPPGGVVFASARVQPCDPRSPGEHGSARGCISWGSGGVWSAAARRRFGCTRSVLRRGRCGAPLSLRGKPGGRFGMMSLQGGQGRAKLLLSRSCHPGGRSW